MFFWLLIVYYIPDKTLKQKNFGSSLDIGQQKFPKLPDDVDNPLTPPLKKGEKGGFRGFRESNPP